MKLLPLGPCCWQSPHLNLRTPGVRTICGGKHKIDQNRSPESLSQVSACHVFSWYFHLSKCWTVFSLDWNSCSNLQRQYKPCRVCLIDGVRSTDKLVTAGSNMVKTAPSAICPPAPRRVSPGNTTFAHQLACWKVEQKIAKACKNMKWNVNLSFAVFMSFNSKHKWRHLNLSI